MAKIFRTPGAALYLGLSPATLEKKRLKGGGPKFISLGGRAIGYTQEDLDDWIQSQPRKSRTEQPAPPSKDKEKSGE